jgi:hypothetical protein
LTYFIDGISTIDNAYIFKNRAERCTTAKTIVRLLIEKRKTDFNTHLELTKINENLDNLCGSSNLLIKDATPIEKLNFGPLLIKDETTSQRKTRRAQALWDSAKERARAKLATGAGRRVQTFRRKPKSRSNGRGPARKPATRRYRKS